MLKITNVFIILLLCAGCHQPVRYSNKLFEKMSAMEHFRLTDQTKAVVLISDNSCAACNQMLSNFAATKLNDDHILFVISAGGNKIDISPYLHTNRNNILYDTGKELYYSDEVRSSTVFILGKQQIDSVIEINPATVETQIAYLKKVL